jgi:predicted phage-related endonuclease
VLGIEGAWGSPFSVYASKLGVETEDNELLTFGREVEDAIAKMYSRQTERMVDDPGKYEIKRHPDIPWLGATLDRLTSGSTKCPAPSNDDGPLELKAVFAGKARDWQEDPPAHYQAQLQIQMACMNSDWGSLCALLGGVKLAWADIVRDDDFLKAAYPQLEKFWFEHVKAQVPPAADGNVATSDAIKALWPVDDGKTVALNHDALLLAEQIDEWKAQKKLCEDSIKKRENHLKTQLGAATFGALPDGSMLTYKTTERAGYVVKPTSFRTLRRTTRRIA